MGHYKTQLFIISAKAVTGGPPFSRFVYVLFTLYVILRTCKHVGADYEFRCYFLIINIWIKYQ